MLYHLIITAVIILLLVGLWSGVQSLARRDRPAHDAEDPDVLACSTCMGGLNCVCGMRRHEVTTPREEGMRHVS